MAMYGIKEQQFRVLSNCAFIEEQSFEYETVQEESLIKIGYLSNVTVTKGIDVFLEICERLINSGLNIQAIIAGPYNDKDSEVLVSSFCKKNKKATYIGPIYGQQKED
ncbi:TPA: glycosyltransferase family 4 protein, partial [Raoultella planticola]|nr:glycosyltransferase family 4 protein [Raoultella planticola]